MEMALKEYVQKGSSQNGIDTQLCLTVLGDLIRHTGAPTPPPHL